MLNLWSKSRVFVIAAGLLFTFGMYFYSYSVGLSKGREELANYKLFVKAAGDAQEAKTKQVIMSQQLLTNEANDEANKLRDALTTYFNNPRVQVKYDTGGRKLPSVPDATSKPKIASTERRPDTSGVEAKECISAVSAAQDAMTILLWQKWADDNANLPH